MKFLFAAAVFFVFASAVCAKTVDSVAFAGEFKTRESFLQAVVRRVVGTEYSPQTDTVIFNALAQTGLFSEIVVLASLQENLDGVLIFVLLKERPNFAITGIGVGALGTMYGENAFAPWIDAFFRYKNFLGLNHTLYWEAALWENRRFGMTWHIPLGMSPYFLDVGALVGRRPSFVHTWLLSPYLNTVLRFGRDIAQNQRLSYEIAPEYRRYSIMRRVSGSNWEISHTADEFWEIYQRISYRFREHDDLYPHLFATFAQISLETNLAKAFENEVFWGINGEFRQNIPISQRARHSFFVRTRFDLTPYGERNIYSGFLTGGAYFVRGWADDFIGSQSETVFNNRVVGTAEYQFLIATLPTFRFNLLSRVYEEMAQFRPQIFGAIFLDGGHLFEDLPSSQGDRSSDIGSANGMSAGFSIRATQPQLRMGGAIDLAWQVAGTPQYIKSNRRAPTLHIGFVQHF